MRKLSHVKAKLQDAISSQAAVSDEELDSDLLSIMEEDERVRKTYPDGSFQSVLGPAKRSVKEGQVWDEVAFLNNKVLSAIMPPIQQGIRNSPSEWKLSRHPREPSVTTHMQSWLNLVLLR